jgi:hypothetical protein
VTDAETALANTVGLKQALMEAKDTLPMYIQAAEDAKYKAEAAYNIAKTHTDTETQRAAEEKARKAWEAASDHCAQAKDLLVTAEDMVSKADLAISLASASLYVAQENDFAPIIDEIDGLIEDAQNGGGDDNGSALALWLETVEKSGTSCSRRAVDTAAETLDNGDTAMAAAHGCDSSSKMMSVAVRGRGAGDWPSKVTAVVGASGEPDCYQRRGETTCTYYVTPGDG